ncbi:putative 30S ribosomal protein S5 [Streptomyces sp. FR-008]|nr:putative 30S ribosomal protein S5 [Streptomyces sp. FR-008]
MNTGALEDGAHGATGDHTGTGGSRLEQDDARGLLAGDGVRDGALDTGDLEEVLLGLLNTLGDGGRHLLGLAVTDTHGAVRVAHHDQRGEAEATTTLHDLGDSVDRDDTLDVRGLLGSCAAVTALPVPPLAATGTASAALGSSHWIYLSLFPLATQRH